MKNDYRQMLFPAQEIIRRSFIKNWQNDRWFYFFNIGLKNIRNIGQYSRITSIEKKGITTERNKV